MDSLIPALSQVWNPPMWTLEILQVTSGSTVVMLVECQTVLAYSMLSHEIVCRVSTHSTM